MNKKLTVMLMAVAMAGLVFARPGPGGHHGGPRHNVPRHHFHGHRHRHHHCGWGIAAAAIGTAAIVRDIVNPAPVVVTPAPTVVAPAPVIVPPTPVVATPAPVVVAPATTVYRW